MADHPRLPPQFYDLLDTDDTLLSNPTNNKSITTTNSWSSFASSDSVLSSPVASEVGSSTETEIDPDEDFMAELTRQMANFMFQDDDELEKWWGSAGSLQSTHWSPVGMNHERQIDSSREPSPPGPNMTEFEKTKMNSERNRSVDFHSKQANSDDQIRAIQLAKLKQGQFMKHIDYRKQLKLYQNKARAYNGYNNIEPKNFRPPTSSSSPWSNMQQQQQTNQQQPSSGMRAVFLGEPGSKTGSGGTGVFLPKGIGNPSESRKKSGCSTVLIPARVVQALKQHFDKVGLPSASKFNEKFPLQHDSMHVTGNERNSLHSQQHQDMDLPQEWTY
ncbi:uncharacterized protein LOC123204002 [Mangifera indica]|uniref:uncharacterized protein LOC123204002 n=1 Tax=Mangifera indica TaxID=29780 RepID=UPI001CFC1590|nr:uncharacterized protein LOC123204002 [Mangifera indica]